MNTLEHLREKQTIEAELAVFWDEMSRNLPKSLERSALGDEKIFGAFQATYPYIRKHTHTQTIQSVRERATKLSETAVKKCNLPSELTGYRNALTDLLKDLEAPTHPTSENK